MRVNRFMAEADSKRSAPVDVFSTVERGHFRTDGSEVEAVLRRLDQIPRWITPLALLLFSRERSTLVMLGPSPPNAT